MILLVAINSKYVHTNLAVRYLYHLSREVYPCKFMEFNINQSLNEVIFSILESKAEFVAISTYIWNRSYVEKLTEGLKKAKKEIKIILGGPEVSFDSLNDWTYADYIIKGEGENHFLDFCKSILLGKDFIQKEYPPYDLSCLPFAYHGESIDVNKIYYYESSRGCPFRCSYCLSSLDKTVRFAPLEKVYDEIQFLFKKEVKLIKFVDRTFNINKERAIKIIEFCKKYSYKTQIHFEIDPTLLDDEIIECFNTSKQGMFRLEIGLQSFNPNTLDAIDRKYDLDKIDKNLKKLIDNNKCVVHLDLIAGLPFEDYEIFKSSLDKTFYYYPDEVQLGFLKMLKGTKIREESNVHGYEYYQFPPYEIIKNDYIDFEKIFLLKKIEDVIDKLYNRQYLFETLKYLFKMMTPSSFFERVSTISFENLSTKEFLRKLYELIKKEFAIDEMILKNLIRYDILRRFSEEFLPEELVISASEKDVIKDFIYSLDVSMIGLKHPKEVFRFYRSCLLEFDIEAFIMDNNIYKGRYLYLFGEKDIKKFKI